MKLASKQRYLIFVRPPGSRMWTQHMKKHGIPYTAFDAKEAMDTAIAISEGGKYCTQVCKVELKQEIDTELKATSHDYDTTYFIQKESQN